MVLYNLEMKVLQDLIGQKFGRLMVVSRCPMKGVRPKWNCQCDCGSSVVVRSDNLVSGKTHSCGCLRDDVAAETCRARQLEQEQDRPQATAVAVPHVPLPLPLCRRHCCLQVGHRLLDFVRFETRHRITFLAQGVHPNMFRARQTWALQPAG